jgi:hypothetical protein
VRAAFQHVVPRLTAACNAACMAESSLGAVLSELLLFVCECLSQLPGAGLASADSNADNSGSAEQQWPLNPTCWLRQRCISLRSLQRPSDSYGNTHKAACALGGWAHCSVLQYCSCLSCLPDSSLHDAAKLVVSMIL